MGLGNFFFGTCTFFTDERKAVRWSKSAVYTDYVVDRLAMCTRNVEVLKERLETSLEGADVEVQPVITQIFTRLNELSHALTSYPLSGSSIWTNSRVEVHQPIRHLFNMLHTYVLAALDSVLQKSNLSIFILFISHGPR